MSLKARILLMGRLAYYSINVLLETQACLLIYADLKEGLKFVENYFLNVWRTWVHTSRYMPLYKATPKEEELRK